MSSVVANWTIDHTEVAVLQEQERLKFSVTNGRETKEGRVDLFSYDASRASRLIQMYHAVIKTNLNAGIDGQAFLPAIDWTSTKTLMSGRYGDAQNVQIALFGKINRAAGKVFEAHWGVYHGNSDVSLRFEIGDAEEEVKHCLLKAPVPEAQNEEAQPRRMADWASHFTTVLNLNARSTIDSISLLKLWRPSAPLYTSTFNRSVVLDEDHWAVTIVSYPNTCVSNERNMEACGKKIQDCGHAMIAYEGVKDRKQFRHYAHITTSRNKDDPSDYARKADQARVEIRDKLWEDELILGPTWPRPRTAVESMTTPIREAQNGHRFIPFEKYRDIYVLAARSADVTGNAVSVASVCYNAYSCIELFLSPTTTIVKFSAKRVLGRCAFNGVLNGLILMAKNRLMNQSGHINCAYWVLGQVPAAGITIDPKMVFLTPNRLVKYLNANPKAVTLT